MEQSDAIIIKNERLTEDIVRLTLLAPTIVATAKPGQFVNVKASQGFDPLLRRPFSIHQIYGDGTLQFVFKVIGKGTKALAELRAGQSVNLVGPLGNHFTTENNICLVGGGLGIAPLLFLARTILMQERPPSLKIILGARNREELTALASDFHALGIEIALATDDGSLGHHGFVSELIPSVLGDDNNWQVCCCGPYPMMRTVAATCRRHGWPCQVSLETMMACGISACLGCTVEASPTNSKGSQYLHVCQDGPVFNEGDIKWKL
jgi:dihydroorotate dehydrogenase electron transfer subunit